MEQKSIDEMVRGIVKEEVKNIITEAFTLVKQALEEKQTSDNETVENEISENQEAAVADNASDAGQEQSQELTDVSNTDMTEQQ